MRIAYFTDLHIGATSDGFHQQPRDPAAPAAVVAAIGRLHAATPLDLLILGGDLTEHGSSEEIEALIALLKPLALPVLICLGNHDLATQDAHARWRSRLAGHRQLRLADGVISLRQADIVGINSWWVTPSGPALYWDPSAAPAAAWDPAQFRWLEQQLALSPEKPAILVMHAPIYPAPTALTGLPAPIHGESEAYAGPARELLERFPRVRLVLAGHSHINCALHQGRYAHLTTTSAIEVPFYARLLEIEEGLLRITTPSLLPEKPDLPPDVEKLWAMGREQDRTTDVDLSDPTAER